ncbi:MAG TPA: hypothetical protein VMZ11_08625 [Mycobacteriales bacterium]|nr:hypothetical protein [Mycobacteriales bacterium]
MALPDRCVAHPSRPAVDRCPVCDRPRCGADASGPGCAVCHGRAAVEPRAASLLELLVRAALGAHALAVVAGVVLQEYPGSPVFGYLAPAVGGAAVGAAATAAAGEPRGPHLQPVRIVAVVYALLATALGFALEGTYDVYEPRVSVLLPYVAAAAAAWFWTKPPKRRVTASEDA